MGGAVVVAVSRVEVTCCGARAVVPGAGMRWRAVKAGREAAVREALTARSSPGSRMWCQAGHGLAVASSRTRWAVVSSSPRVVRGKQTGLGCLDMSSPVPNECRVRAWSGAAQPAVLNHILTTARVMPFPEPVCWLRPSWLTCRRVARGNGSRRLVARSTRG